MRLSKNSPNLPMSDAALQLDHRNFAAVTQDDRYWSEADIGTDV
jgi:hypothetical protein